MASLQANLAARESVAGPALEAILQVNSNERSEFQSTMNHNRQQLISFLAWDFRQLLAAQQQLLQKAKLPGFVDVGITMDADLIRQQSGVCSVMHSAFVLREKVGVSSHAALLTSLVKRLEKEVKEAPTGANNTNVPQPHLIHNAPNTNAGTIGSNVAVPPHAAHNMPNTAPPYFPQPPPQQPQYNPQLNHMLQHPPPLGIHAPPPPPHMPQQHVPIMPPMRVAVPPARPHQHIHITPQQQQRHAQPHAAYPHMGPPSRQSQPKRGKSYRGGRGGRTNYRPG